MRMATAARTSFQRERVTDARGMAAEHIALHRRGLVERHAFTHQRCPSPVVTP